MFFNIIFKILCSFKHIYCFKLLDVMWQKQFQEIHTINWSRKHIWKWHHLIKLNNICRVRTALDTCCKLQIQCFQPNWFLEVTLKKRNIKISKAHFYGIRIGPCNTQSHHRTIDHCVYSAMTRKCYDVEAMVKNREDDNDAMARQCDNVVIMAR